MSASRAKGRRYSGSALTLAGRIFSASRRGKRGCCRDRPQPIPRCLVSAKWCTQPIPHHRQWACSDFTEQRRASSRKTCVIQTLDRDRRPGLRIVTVMDGPVPERPDRRYELVSRRRLLRLAGGAGLVATVDACSVPTTRTNSPATPGPTATAGLKASPAATPPPEHMTSPTSTSSARSAVLLCRDAWGARPARSGGTPHTITRMTIHHTAVVLGDNRNAPARLRQHQQYHQDTQGWIDIAYHIGVDRNGNIYELRSPPSSATPQQATTRPATSSLTAKETSMKRR